MAGLNAVDILKRIVEENPEGYTYDFDPYSYEHLDNDFLAQKVTDYRNIIAEAKEQGKSFEELEFPTFKEYLHNAVYEKYQMAEFLCYSALPDIFEGDVSLEEYKVVADYLEEKGITLYAALSEQGFKGVNFDVADDLGEYEMNIMFSTKAEQNFEMQSIRDMIQSPENYAKMLDQFTPEQQDEHFDNALSYLVHQQGYKVSELVDIVLGDKETENEFLQSVANEYANTGDYAKAELTALVTLDKEGLDLLDKMIKGEGSISISKDAPMGIFNEWQGSGAEFEISLDKDFEVPASMISNIQIETTFNHEANKNYTVAQTYENAVYGCVTSWEGKASLMENDVDASAIMKGVKDDIDNIIDVAHKYADIDKEKE